MFIGIVKSTNNLNQSYYVKFNLKLNIILIICVLSTFFLLINIIRLNIFIYHTVCFKINNLQK